MSIRIGSNITSLLAQRRLSEATDSLSNISERLSSGQRINRASDDAAGLAIADNLRADVRIRSQAIRNLSDGISLLRIAEGALGQLTGITTRISELAEQAANGVYSLSQRRALNKEADSLVQEFNRIVGSTSFNGRQIFSRDQSFLSLQAGVGNNAILSTDLMSLLGRNIGDGTFSADTALTTGGAGGGRAYFLDMNNDGVLDLASISYADGITVRMGNGDGTFGSVMTTSNGGGADGVFADLNGDGILDYASAAQFNVNGLSVRLGNGDGTFRAVMSFDSSGVSDERYTYTLDFDGDGKLDIATVGWTGGVSLYRGNGDGSFAASAVTFSSTLNAFASGDVNGDGRDDIILGIGGADVRVFLSNGNGTFQANQSFNVPGGTQLGSIYLTDTNRDGILDFVGSRGGVAVISLGNGNGTFGQTTTYQTNLSVEGGFAFGDVNGDGYVDLIGSAWNQTSMRVLYGNGDGSFRAGITVSGVANTSGWTATGDINGDGVDEIINYAQPVSQLQIVRANTVKSADIEFFDLLSAQDARAVLDRIKNYRERIAQQLGQSGAFESRLRVASANLKTERENFIAAESRIRDADIAADSAEYVRKQILQQMASSVLAQANVLPQLAIRLLRDGR